MPTEPPASPIAGRYAILAPLGAGGMGIVHRVRDRHTDRLFALKRPRWSSPPASTPCLDPRASLERESLALSRLDHPHVVRRADAGLDESGEPFLVLELLERTRMIVDLSRSAPRAQRLRALAQMFHALAHIHGNGLVHGDVAPSNVLVCGHPGWPDAPRSLEPRVCLIDFGLAAVIGEHATLPELEASGPSSLAGSLLYLAPELIEGASMSTASDLYGAGMIAVEVLTGSSPRSRVGPRMTLAALRAFPAAWLDEAAVSLGRDPRVLALLRRLLARDPEQRCSCAAEVAAEIDTIGKGSP